MLHQIATRGPVSWPRAAHQFLCNIWQTSIEVFNGEAKRLSGFLLFWPTSLLAEFRGGFMSGPQKQKSPAIRFSRAQDTQHNEEQSSTMIALTSAASFFAPSSSRAIERRYDRRELVHWANFDQFEIGVKHGNRWSSR